MVYILTIQGKSYSGQIGPPETNCVWLVPILSDAPLLTSFPFRNSAYSPGKPFIIIAKGIVIREGKRHNWIKLSISSGLANSLANV